MQINLQNTKESSGECVCLLTMQTACVEFFNS